MNKNKTYKFKFSIVITNPKKIDINKNAIKSLLKQTIGFKDNIQIIIIGFIDNEIKKYIKQYSNNIKTIDSELTYKSELKNEGLKYCEGKYINFISHQNFISKSTLEEVYSFFEKNSNIIDLVAIPTFSFETNKLNNRYIDFKDENYIVELKGEPQNFITSNQSAFYKSSIFNNLKFNTELGFNEDIDLNFKLHSQNQKIGYVAKKAKCIYKKNNDEAEKICPNKFVNSVQVIENILSEDYSYIKEYVIYETLHKLHKIKKEFFDDLNEYNQVIDRYKKCLDKIDDEFIFTNSKILRDLDQKYFILKLKENKTSLVINNDGNLIFKDCILSSFDDIHFKIKKMDLIENYIFIDIMYNDYNVSNIDIKLIDFNNIEYISYYNEKVKSPYDIKHGEFTLNEIRLVKFKVPITENIYTINIVNSSDVKFQISNFSMLSFLKFSLYDKQIKRFHNEHCVSFDSKHITVKKEKYNNFMYIVKTFLHIVRKYKFFAFSRLLNRKNKKYILINDRPEKAGDNGEALFKYIHKNEKELAKNIYFILAKKDKEYKRLKKYGKIVIQNSLKHKYLFINSKLIASSHAAKQFYTPFKMELLKYYADLVSYKFLWLQHGVIHNNVSRSVNKYNANIDYFVVSSFKEKEEIELDRYFYDKKDIILTGLPRFDYLESNPKNIISLVPTWRRTLSGRILSCGFHETKEGFEQSDYYKEYSSLLKNKKLNKLLKKYNFTLNFNIHPGMAGYENHFQKFENERINIISAYNVDYNRIFRESNLLITDYSSVAFDFAYLRKPLMYFQFDREEFYRHQYERGYFDYTKDGFGKVIENVDELVKKLEHYFSTNFKVENEYLEKNDSTFAYKDKCNCQRIIDKLKLENII
jgi:CDP-glycerol glycerophosphotransferase (TagB/SpsB family)